MAVGLFTALPERAARTDRDRGAPQRPASAVHMLTATMKGIVALSGLEAVSNGSTLRMRTSALRWGKSMRRACTGCGVLQREVRDRPAPRRPPVLRLGDTLFLTYFSPHFNVFDGTSDVRWSAICRSWLHPGAGRTLLFWVTRSGGGVAGRRLHDSAPGRTGDRMADVAIARFLRSSSTGTGVGHSPARSPSLLLPLC
jgi:hypothetical protein